MTAELPIDLPLPEDFDGDEERDAAETESGRLGDDDPAQIALL